MKNKYFVTIYFIFFGKGQYKGMQTEREIKISFLKNLNLQPINKNNLCVERKKKQKSDNLLCIVKMEKIDWEEHIPLAKYKKLLKYKKSLGTKQCSVKLNRIKTIWQCEKITVTNFTIKI